MTGELVHSMKHRLTGAVIWLALLVVIVPIWYNNPVNFQPESAGEKSDIKTEAVVDKAYTFKQPAVSSEPETEKASEASPDQESKSPVAKSEVVTETAHPLIKGEWIIRVAAFKKREDAQALKQRLKYDYDVFIKYFPKSEYYSVRLGPYFDQIEAIKDQKRLESVLRTKSELVKIK